jgi:hypothetical protein
MTKTNTITGYKWEDATLNIIQPIFLSVFLISVAWKKPSSIRSMMVPLICIIVLIFQPLYLNYRSIVIDQPNNKKMAQLLYPLSAFSKDITDISGAVFYISPNINKEYQMLSRHTDEIRSMFNVYFHQGLETDAFINLIIFKPGKGILIYPDPLETLPKMNYDYAIITSNDWGRILQNPELLDLFQRNYEITFDDQDTIGLLSKKVK